MYLLTPLGFSHILDTMEVENFCFQVGKVAFDAGIVKAIALRDILGVRAT